MFGAQTSNFKLGKYTASSRPLDPVADWTENFKKISDQMWNTESTLTGVENSVKQMLADVEEQHTLVDGLNNRVATTATKLSQTNLNLGDVRITVNQASTIASGALALATSALSNAQKAQSTANTALSLNSGQITKIASLRARVLELEKEED